jgi:hypothetical protein
MGLLDANSRSQRGDAPCGVRDEDWHDFSGKFLLSGYSTSLVPFILRVKNQHTRNGPVLNYYL